jgi:hypothetical protein
MWSKPFFTMKRQKQGGTTMKKGEIVMIHGTDYVQMTIKLFKPADWRPNEQEGDRTRP